MNKIEMMKKLSEEKLVAVIRGDNEEEVFKIVDAVNKGGINFLEITFTIPNAQNIISNLSEKYKDNDDVVIGAGTCMDVITARLAILSGAQFIVCPHFDEEIIKLCNLYGIPIFPGATTVRDIKECLTYGAQVIKLFPGGIMGPSAIKAFKGPSPQADFMPTGGVSADNLKEWLKAGAIAVGTGSSLTAGAANNDFNKVEQEASKLVKLVREFQSEK